MLSTLQSYQSTTRRPRQSLDHPRIPQQRALDAMQEGPEKEKAKAALAARQADIDAKKQALADSAAAQAELAGAQAALDAERRALDAMPEGPEKEKAKAALAARQAEIDAQV